MSREIYEQHVYLHQLEFSAVAAVRVRGLGEKPHHHVDLHCGGGRLESGGQATSSAVTQCANDGLRDADTPAALFRSLDDAPPLTGPNTCSSTGR